jgi:saccharopine dehydrogenase-like NADP-dependent oxidoreductase
LKKVLVIGVTGRTGAIAWQKLCQRTDEFIPSGFARSEAKVKQLFGSTEGCFFGDVRDKASLEAAIASCQALIILSSAIAKMKAPLSPGQRPIFEYEPGGMPVNVDFDALFAQTTPGL